MQIDYMKKINKKRYEKKKKIINKKNKPINKTVERRKEKIGFVIERRYKFLIVLISILMLALIAKLVYMQVVKYDDYEVELKRLTKKIVDGQSTPRGRIYDRNGKIIVDNESVKTIYYKKVPGVTTKEELALSYKMADMIDVDYSKLNDDAIRTFWVQSNRKKARAKIKDKEWNKVKERKITSDDIYELEKKRVTDEELNALNERDREAAYIYYLMNKGYSYVEKNIKNEGVTDEEYARVAENIDLIPGFNIKLDWQRSYPYGDTLRTILGNVSTSENGIPSELKQFYLDKGYARTDRVGTSYLEYQYEEYLKGEKSTYEIMNDGSSKEIKSGARGNDIVLTIDIELQKQVEDIISEELLAAKTEPNTEFFNKSFVIITDPNNGEILVMAGKKIVSDSAGGYKVVDYTPGVITSSVTPGSVVKGASHIVGYNAGALKIGEIRNDACIKIAATPLKCSYHEYGNIDDIQALKYSSNTYQFQTAIKVGKGNYVYDGPLKLDQSAFETYRNTFKQFGLGVKTEIDLPNESLGYKGENTLSGYLLDFSIGQYDTYTPIEISQYISTIATNGKRMQPHLLKEIYDGKTKDALSNKIKDFEIKELNTVDTKQEYLDRVHEGFKQVVAPGGTGSGYVEYSRNVAGKTGTAESFIDSDSDGKIDTETISASFAGYAPYDSPKITFTVISPDVGGPNTDYNGMSKVNMRITKKITEKYFEFYQ